MIELPIPLVAADVDLRDFAFMPLDVVRLRDSEIATKAKGDEFRCAVLLWCAAWHQVPAASLPDDDDVLSQYAGFGRVVREWKKIKTGALRGWVKCSDGRLYHPVVAEKANDAWKAKLEQRWKTECARIKKHMQRHKTSLQLPEFDEWMSQGCPQGQPLPVPMVEQGCPQGQPHSVPRETPSKGSEGKGRENSKPSETIVSGGKPPAMKPDEIIFGYGVPLLTNAGTAEKQARSFLGGLRKAHGDAAVIDKLRECMRAKPLQPLEWLAKALPPDGVLGHSKQSQLESRNAAVVAGWIPPELRQKEATA